ncbi:MAG: zinc ribbon domain-containing protein [Anaerolineae bacterium]|nr:zinc ribbon domain-containing protein [Anaerolineae bacterium]
MKCSSCGASNRPNARFCRGCGEALPAQPAPNVPKAAPSSYPPAGVPYAAGTWQPTKDKAIAYILEILLLGLGWIYAGETGTGIAILVGWIIVGLMIGIPVDLATGGLGCLCTVPMAIVAYGLSLTRLSKYMNARPHIFR